MTASIIILPVVRGFKHKLDALEQRDREVAGFLASQQRVPFRTRPLLVVVNHMQPPAVRDFPKFRSAAPVDMAGDKGRAPNVAGHSLYTNGGAQ